MRPTLVGSEARIVKKLRRHSLQRLRHSLHIEETHVSLAPLDLTHMRSIDASQMSKPLLGQS